MLQIIKNDILYVFNSSVLFVKELVSEIDEIIKSSSRKELFAILIFASVMTCLAVAITVIAAMLLHVILYVTYGIPLIILIVFYLLVVYRETKLKKKDEDVVN